MKYLTPLNNKISKKFQLGALTTLFWGMIFADMAVKLVQPVSIYVHPCYLLQQTTGNSFNVPNLRLLFLELK